MFKNYQTERVVNFLFTNESALETMVRLSNYEQVRSALREIDITETSEHVALNDSSLDIDELDWQVRQHHSSANDPVIKLIIEYRKWIIANGLDETSASDLVILNKLHLDQTTLSNEQRAWFRGFSQRWSAAQMLRRLEALSTTIVKCHNRVDDPLAKLAIEYHEWIITNGLDIESAWDLVIQQKLLLDDSTLSNQQRSWFRDFAQRWGMARMLENKRLEDHFEREDARRRKEVQDFTIDLDIPGDWIDSSYLGEGPSFWTRNGLWITIDHVDESLRKGNTDARFRIHEDKSSGCIVDTGAVLLGTESFAEVLHFVRNYDAQ